MSKNIWDVVGKAGESAARAAVASRNAKNTLQSELMLYKIKNQFEQAQKQGEIKDKFGYDLAMEKEKASMPFKAYQEFQSGQGNPGGAPNVTMGPDAKMRVLKLKDMAEQIYMKPPNTWSPQEKQIVEQYKAFTLATRTPRTVGSDDMFSSFRGGESPTDMPSIPTRQDMQSEIILSDPKGNQFRLKNPGQLQEALNQGYKRVK